MGRNLVVCCDGTWNTPDQRDRDRLAPSNVVKMARAVRTEGTRRQLVYYDAGVGTRGLVDRITGGALGRGLMENIQQAYEFIAKTHDDLDQIYLFGFSRGAYTVRSLAGLIGLCGIPRDRGDLASRTQAAYALYRTPVSSRGERWRAALTEFHEGQRDVRIRYVGVWDTVGSLGVPDLFRAKATGIVARLFERDRKLAHGFHDVKLGDSVDFAWHALAADEKRRPFQPTLWSRRPGQDEVPHVKQAWFAGVHSNVGGGYADAGLSDHALLWIAKGAQEAGLELDDLYLALRIDPNAHGEMRDSLSWVYRMAKKERVVGAAETLSERIHWSTLKRYREPTSGYAEQAISDLAEVIETQQLPTDTSGRELIATLRTGRAGSFAPSTRLSANPPIQHH